MSANFGRPALARIIQIRVGGETFFEVRISIDGMRRPVMRRRELPTLQCAQLEALEWGDRFGKELQWRYDL